MGASFNIKDSKLKVTKIWKQSYYFLPLSKNKTWTMLNEIWKRKLTLWLMTINIVFSFGILDMYTIKFQNCGLTYVHLFLFLHPSNKYSSPDDIYVLYQ